MTFDKFIYRESGYPGQGVRLAVDFAVGEITVWTAGDGEVMWRRLAGPCLAVLRTKTAACAFDAWHDGSPAPDGDGPGWSLEFCFGGKTLRRVSGGAMPARWQEFQSVLDLCGALAENRSKRKQVLLQAAT